MISPTSAKRRRRARPAAILSGWIFGVAALIVIATGGAIFASPDDGSNAHSGAQAGSPLDPSGHNTPSGTPSPNTTAPDMTAPGTPATSDPAASAHATELLATLPVKGKAAATGYDRTGMFGSAWIDVDDNGCDTRNDILARDLTDLGFEGSCRILTGTLADPYTGQSIAFVRGNATSSKVQIDHIVALQNAWVTGAQKLSQEQRKALANDPLNLLAVDGPTNSSKGAGDAATWLPPQKSYRCAYVSRQIEVKAAYSLWITSAERDAMERVLSTCPAG